jgi:hypothetical protein
MCHSKSCDANVKTGYAIRELVFISLSNALSSDIIVH